MSSAPSRRVPDTCLVRRARKIDRVLAETYPDARCELDFDNAFELLVVTVLSAQTTDQRVNAVTPGAVRGLPRRRRDGRRRPGEARADHPADRLLPGQDRVAAQALPGPRRAVRRRGARPGSRTWSTLPGVGRKTANVVLGNAFGIPGITVDTHFGRLARRFGWTEQTDPVKAEHEVGALFPKRDWTMLSPPPDLARPPGLPRPQPRLRRLPGRALVPGVRRGPDRPGRGRQAGPRPRAARETVAAARCWPACSCRVAAPATRAGDPAGRCPGRATVDVDTPELRALEGEAPASSPAAPAPGRRRATPARRSPCPASAAAATSTSTTLRGPAGDQPLRAVVRAVPRRAAATTSGCTRRPAARSRVLGVDYLDTQPDGALALVDDDRRRPTRCSPTRGRAAQRPPDPRPARAWSSSTPTAGRPTRSSASSAPTPSSRDLVRGRQLGVRL